MKWEHPPIAKIYEALGSVVDGRVEEFENSAKVYSSSGNKFYDIQYDPESNSIMANDNASYWKEYLGYPSIAFLMKTGVLSYDYKTASLLKGIVWKDINQKFKNDFDRALEYILSSKTDEERKKLDILVRKIDGEIKVLDLNLLGNKTNPPEGY